MVKFVSRMTRDTVISRKKELKGSDIFVAEYLTRLNNKVLTSLRKKKENEIKQAWSQNGKLYNKNKHDHVHIVKFMVYQYWLELDWHENKTQ